MAQKKLGSIKLSDNVLVTSTNLATEVTGTLGVANGGTGQSVYTNGQLLIGNTTGNTLTKATLTAGTGITITNGAGAITIATSIIGSQWLNSGSNIYFSSGNVAIGTTPSASIELLLRGAGATNATFSLSTENSAATNTFYVRDDGAVAIPNGNLGIGTSPTTQRLQVNGTTTISGQLTLSQANGTAPMVVTSTTRVANLNVATAGTADQLTTARTINGVSFNGTANITVAAAAGTLTGTTLASGVTASSLTSVGTLTSLAVSGNASVGPISSGADGLNVAVTRNLTFGEGSSNSYLNLFRQANSGGTVLANGYKYSATADGFASSTSVAWAKSAIRLANGDIQFYADASTTVANGTDATPSPRVIIGRAGNVGIGTTSPATALHLLGTLTVGNSTYSRPALTPTNWGYSSSYRVMMVGSASTSYSTQNTGAVTVAFNYDPSGNANGSFTGDGREILFRNGTQFVTPNSANTSFNLSNLVLLDGNVGIGTTSPNASLDVQGNYITVHNNTTSINTICANLSLANKGTVSATGPDAGARIVAITGSGNWYDSTQMAFYTHPGPDVTTTASVERMRITGAGNVGIGTTSPIGRFHVSAGNSGVIGLVAGATRAVRFGADAGVAYVEGVDQTGTGSYQPLAVGGSIVTFLIDGTERARINTSGNVGIGTSSPGARLHASVASSNDIIRLERTGTTAGAGFIYANANEMFGVQDGTRYPFQVKQGAPTDSLVIASSGNVGIGTTSPSNLLHLKASSNPVLRLEGASDSGYVDYNGTRLQLSAGGGAIYFVSGNTERVRIDSSGNVGIGTTSPNTYLHVAQQGNRTGGNIQMGATGNATTKFSWLTGTHYNADTNPAGFSLIGGLATSTDNEVIIGGYIYESNPATVIKFYTHTATTHSTGGSERARITSAGDMFVGTTTSWSSARFVSERNSTSVPAAEFNGTGQTAGLAPVYIWNNAESGSTYFISFYSDGVNNARTLRGYINYRRDNTTMNLTTASDYRIKIVHGPYTKSGDIFDGMKVHEATVKGESGKYPMVLAHELQEVYPSAVDGEKDAVNEDGTPKLQMVSYTAMIPLMLAEIKSLRARVAELEAR